MNPRGREDLLNAHRFLGKMLRVRGYNTDHVPAATRFQDLFPGNVPKTTTEMSLQLSRHVYHKSGAKMLVRFILEPVIQQMLGYIFGAWDQLQVRADAVDRVSVAFHELCQRLMDDSERLEIILCCSSITDAVEANLIKEDPSMNLRVWVFNYSCEMQHFPLDHVCVPRYTIITAGELEAAGINPAECPRERLSRAGIWHKRRGKTSVGYPIAKLFGVDAGAVFRVDTRNMDGTFMVKYRVVVHV